MSSGTPGRKSGQVRRKAGATPQQADKRRYIIKHAAELFSRVGYSAATMDDLSDRTGLNKGTLYYYYAAKSDILYEIVRATHEASHACLDAVAGASSPAVALSSFIDGMVDWISQNKEHAIILSKEQDYFEDTLPEDKIESARSGHRAYMRKLYGVIQAGVDSGVFKNCDVRVVGRAISTMLFNSASWRLSTMGPAAISTQIKQLLMDGLKT